MSDLKKDDSKKYISKCIYWYIKKKKQLYF